MRVRDAKPSDAESIRNVHFDSIKELGIQSYSQEQVDAWAKGCESADYTAAIKSDNLEYIVADRDGEVIGFGSLKLVPPEGYEATVDGEVTAVYVHPNVARNGVGTNLYRELEQRAKANNFQTLGLSASLNAVPFYETHGYKRVKEHEHEFSSHESTSVTGVVVEMKKEI